MASFANPMWSETVLPARADVVIVGGGIVGVTAALFLSEKGLSVALCEKGQIAGEQSGTNWGGVRTTGRDPLEVPLSIQSLRLWREMNQKVGAETGFRRSGLAYLCDSLKDLEAHESWFKKCRDYEIDARLIGSNEIQEIMPGAARRWAGALYGPSDGIAEPPIATSAIATAAQRHGVSVVTECAVRGIETSAGRVSGAITERGSIACDALVLAGGIWSRLFCGNLGIHLPMLSVISSVCRTSPVDGAPQCTAIASDFAFRRCLDGGYMVARPGGTITELVPDCFRLFADFLPVYWKQRKNLRVRVGAGFLRELRTPRRWSLGTISPFEFARVSSARPNRSVLRGAQTTLALSFPAFRDIPAIQSWAGSIDVTPDGLPVISPVQSLPGFYMACGFSGRGFGLGPGAGRLVADLVAGDTPIADPTPFRHARFA